MRARKQFRAARATSHGGDRLVRMQMRAIAVGAWLIGALSACGSQASPPGATASPDAAAAGRPEGGAAAPIDIEGVNVPLVEGIARTGDYGRGVLITLHSRAGNCEAYREKANLASQVVMTLFLRSAQPGTYALTDPPDVDPPRFFVRLQELDSSCEARDVAGATAGTVTIERVSAEGIEGTLRVDVSAPSGPATVPVLQGRFFAPFCAADIDLRQSAHCTP